jgi:hypothetical protein
MTTSTYPNRTLRRRIVIASLPAAAAVATIVAVTTAGSATAEAGRGSALTPAETHASVSAPAPARVLGPVGLGRLKLGMNRAQALASGVIARIDPANGACALIHLVGSPTTPNSGDGYLSRQYGIVSILPPAGVKTPEGIGVGSTIAAVKRAYPGTVYNTSTRQDGGPRAAVPGHANEYYSLPDGGTGIVQRIGLVMRSQDCFG